MLDLEFSNDTRKVYTNICKDGRLRSVIVNDDGSKQTISYPRLLMEKELGRKLLSDEDVHHIDNDYTNNNIENFQIIKHGEHQKQHSTKYHDKYITCDYCGKEFLWSAKQQKIWNSNKSRKSNNDKERHVFCSKSCSGKYGRAKQLNRDIPAEHISNCA